MVLDSRLRGNDSRTAIRTLCINLLGLRQFTVRPVFRMIFPHFSISENLCKPCGYDAAQVVAHAPG